MIFASIVSAMIYGMIWYDTILGCLLTYSIPGTCTSTCMSTLCQNFVVPLSGFKFEIWKSAPKSPLRSQVINDYPEEDFFRKALTYWKKRAKNAKSAPVSWWRGRLFLRTFLVYSYDNLKSSPFESYSYHFSQEFKKTSIHFCLLSYLHFSIFDNGVFHRYFV